MLHIEKLLLAICLFPSAYATSEWKNLRALGPQGVNLWRLEKAEHTARSQSTANSRFTIHNLFDTQEVLASSDFEPQWFEQPLDHFTKSDAHTWHQRFWVNTRHYRPGEGTPVIVIDGGETSGENRLPFLDTGIGDILAKATGGISVVLEHRYYGLSMPVQNLTTDSLRWLDNEQAAADSANFMANVKFDGIDENLTAPGTPWIYYGGSYAGARSAHMKILYPDLVYGAIASSAVTHAAIENWQYMEIIRKAADPKCSNHLVNSINTVDSILAHGKFKHALKALFGLSGLEHDDDFASMLSNPLGSWQSKNWDPAVGSTSFDAFCTALGKPFGTMAATATELPFGDPARLVTVEDGFSVDFSIINYGNWIKSKYVSRCPQTSTVEDCFGTYDDAKYQETGLDQDWRLWTFQVCTQWGYFTTAPPDQKQPRIISRVLDLAYESKICKQAYLPGKHFTVPRLPNITAVNALGDFEIAADRLAFIDGEVDPWRPDTPHSEDAPKRKDTMLRPFKLIPDGVHHYDENGLKNLLDEPSQIRKIHAEEVTFVLGWLRDWKPPKKH